MKYQAAEVIVYGFPGAIRARVGRAHKKRILACDDAGTDGGLVGIQAAVVEQGICHDRVGSHRTLYLPGANVE